MTLVLIAALVVALVALGVWTVLSRRRTAERIVAIVQSFDEDGGPFTGDLDQALRHLEGTAERSRIRIKQIKAESHRYRSALSELRTGVVLADHEGNEVFRNAAADAASVSAPSRALVAAAVREKLAAAVRGTEVEKKITHVGPPASSFEVRSVSLTDGQMPLGGMVTVRDTTSTERLEQMRRDFVANLGHELRTPVGAIGLLAETMEGEPDADIRSRLLRRIMSETDRIGAMLEDLLALSRIESVSETRSDEMDVDALLAEATLRVAHLFAAGGIELIRHPSEVAVLTGDRDQLLRALTNLLENAAKYSDPGSSVEIGCEAGDDIADLVVADHGIGIPATELTRIFERFYRVDRARDRATGGTGLGLSIVRHVALNHGGEVGVSSREGAGSVFRLRIPLRGHRP
ncbi:MAG TPA: two-component sensor histidine kinase [Acidimicrobiales bacterium]|nr:two-component sensor histidine kinase [Acidimicrobiales bacterium]